MSVTGPSAEECPRCHFSMERLDDSQRPFQEQGYELESSGEGVAVGYGIAGMFGILLGWIWQQTLQPLAAKLFGDWSDRRWQRLLAAYPNTVVCTHCGFVIKRA